MKTIKKNQMTSCRHGGRRTGSGRKVGSANTRTREIADQAMASGQSPLEFLLGIMRDPNNPIDLRVEAAKICCPFVHPRLQAIEHSGPEGVGIPQNITVEFV